MLRLALLAVFVFAQNSSPTTSGAIRGRIVNADGTPATGVRVGAIETDSVQDTSLLADVTETDNAGNYRLNSMRPGRYYVTAGRLDKPTFYPGTLERQSATLVNVTEGKSAENVDFQIAQISAGFELRGRVSAWEAVPEHKATVQLLEAETGIARTQQVNADGFFEFTRLPPGSYTAWLTDPIPYAYSAITRVSIADHDVTGVEITVRRQKEISGRVVIEGKTGMPRFNITLPRMSDSVFFDVQETIAPDSRGVFSISTLEGTQSLAPGGLPQGYRVKSFTYGNVDVTAGPLNIAVTDTAELRLVLESARPVRVRGLVVDLEKLGIASESLRVALRSPNFVDGPEAVVGKDGRFEFPEVMPGMYTPTFQGFKAPQTRELLIVDGEDIDSLEVEAPDRKEVEGRVMIQGDAPVPRFKLVWRRFDKWAAEIEEAAQKSGIQISLGPDWSSDTLDIDPQPDGTFKLSLFEGVYEIWILLPAGYKLAVDESRMTVRHAGPTVLRVQVETWGRPVNVIGHVDGLDRASFALPDATVSLTTSRHAVVSTSTLDKNGAFAFPNVFPGTYALRLNAPGLPNDICAPVTVKEDDPTNAAIAVPLPGVHQDSLQIISAIFGNRQGAADVTPMARKMIKPELAEIYATPAWLEVDPAAFTHKELTVSYLFRCADYTFTTREAGAVSYAMLVQNADPSRRAPATGNGDFRVLSAYYTAGSHYDNITPRIQELATPNRDPFDVAVATQGSLTFKPRGRSYLIVTYLLEGRRATLAVNPYLAPKLSYEWLAAFAKYSSGVGAVVPNWLAEAQPYSPREPGDPGPGFGKEPEREIGIAALLKAHAELKALAPEDSTSKVAHAISAIERALALAQTNYVYPSPGAKPILIAVPKATWKQRFDYARDALSEALGVLEAANTLSDTQSLTMKIEDEIDQALIDLDEAENGLTEIRGASSVPNSPLCVLCVSVVNFP